WASDRPWSGTPSPPRDPRQVQPARGLPARGRKALPLRSPPGLGSSLPLRPPSGRLARPAKRPRLGPFCLRSVFRFEFQRRAVQAVDTLEGSAVRAILQRRQAHADLVAGLDRGLAEAAPDHEVDAGALDAPLILAAL